MARYTDGVRVRVTPSLRRAIWRVAQKLNERPSTIVRVGLEAVFNPNEAGDVLIKAMRDAAKSRESCES